MLVLGQRSSPATILAKERFSERIGPQIQLIEFGSEPITVCQLIVLQLEIFPLDFVKFCVIQLALCKADRFEIGVAEGSKIADARFKCTVTKNNFLQNLYRSACSFEVYLMKASAQTFHIEKSQFSKKTFLAFPML